MIMDDGWDYPVRLRVSTPALLYSVVLRLVMAAYKILRHDVHHA